MLVFLPEEFPPSFAFRWFHNIIWKRECIPVPRPLSQGLQEWSDLREVWREIVPLRQPVIGHKRQDSQSSARVQHSRGQCQDPKRIAPAAGRSASLSAIGLKKLPFSYVPPK